MTYVERQLQGLGFHRVAEEKDSVGFEQAVILSIGHLRLQFVCCCPYYPSIRGLGCPLHHDGPGGSWPVYAARVLAALLTA